MHCNQVFLCCVFRHGPLFSVQVLKRQFVVVNSFDLVWDVLVKRSAEFSGRIKSYRSGLCLGEDVFSKVCGSCANCQMKIIRKIIRKFMTQLVCTLYLNSNPHEVTCFSPSGSTIFNFKFLTISRHLQVCLFQYS